MGFEHHHEGQLEHENPRLDVPRESGERLGAMRLRISRKDLPRLREALRNLEAYRDRLQQQLASHIYPMPGGGPSFAPGTYPHGGGGPGLNFGPRGYPGNLLGGRSGWYHGGGFPGGGFQGFRGNFGLQRPFGNFGRQQYNWYSGFPAYEGGGGGPWLGNLGGGFKHKMGPGLVVPS